MSMSSNNSGFTVTTESWATTVEIRQKTKGEMQPIPVEYLNGYSSPSGGYVNYACYKIQGRNAESKRKSSRIIFAFNEDEAKELAIAKGLEPPFEFSIQPNPEPTEAQLMYAKVLEIVIPDGVCKVDISSLISRVTDDDELPPDKWTVEKALQLKLQFSRYIGKKALLDYVTQTIINSKKLQK